MHEHIWILLVLVNKFLRIKDFNSLKDENDDNLSESSNKVEIKSEIKTEDEFMDFGEDFCDSQVSWLILFLQKSLVNYSRKKVFINYKNLG